MPKSTIAKRKNLKGWNGNWQVLELELLFLKFDLATHAEPTLYYWTYLHPRAGDKTTSTLGFSGNFVPPMTMSSVGVSGSIAVERTVRDVVLDADGPLFCDDANGIGSHYNTGAVRFYIKENEAD